MSRDAARNGVRALRGCVVAGARCYYCVGNSAARGWRQFYSDFAECPWLGLGRGVLDEVARTGALDHLLEHLAHPAQPFHSLATGALRNLVDIRRFEVRIGVSCAPHRRW